MALSGKWSSTGIDSIIYGPGCLENALPEALDELKASKALIITGKTLATKTDVIKKVEKVLSSRQAHAATFHNIGEHAPVAGIREAVQLLEKNEANVLVGVGGGSPIDAAKAIAYYYHEQHPEKPFLPQIAIPTTLSSAETTTNAGFTSEEGVKTGVASRELGVKVIILDAELTLSTPERLWLSSGMRAVDHAIELLYRPNTPYPILQLCYSAIRDLFTFLSASKQNPNNIAIRQALQLAAADSLFPSYSKGAIGLSHGLGHKLGATYGIPHGITSCLTLSGSINLIATSTALQAEPRLLANLSEAIKYIPEPFVSKQPTLGSAPMLGLGATPNEVTAEILSSWRDDGRQVSRAVQRLVEELGLKTSLSAYGLKKDDCSTVAEQTLGKDHAGLTELKNFLESIY